MVAVSKVASLFGAAVIGLFGISPCANAQQYTVTDVGTLGGADSYIAGINASGQVTGWSDTTGGLPNAFLYSNGTIQNLGALTGTNTSYGNGVSDNSQVTGYSYNTTTNAYQGFSYSNGTLQSICASCTGQGINDSGQITGGTTTIGMNGSAFLYNNGTIQLLGLGGSEGEGTAINNSGQVAGWSYLTNDSTYHAFLYSNGITQDLGTLAGGTQSQANGISSNGLVVGVSTNYVVGQSHAFLYDHGVLQDLGTLGGPASGATGVNSSGEVVGHAELASGTVVPFLYSDGKMVNLNSLLPSSAAALYTLTVIGGSGIAINDNGQIAVDGYLNSNPGDIVALLLTPTSPVPLPTTAWLMLLGLGCLGPFARRKPALTM